MKSTSQHQKSHHNVVSKDRRRETSVLVIGGFSVVVLLGLGFASMMSGERHVGLADFSAAAILAVMLCVFHFTRFKQACCYFAVAMMYLLFMYLFFVGAGQGKTYMWHYTFPFFATFLIGARHGAIATLCLFAPVFIAIINEIVIPDMGLGYYSKGFAMRYFPSVSMALVFAYLFERERERFSKQSEDSYKEQERIIKARTEQLKKEVEERESIARQLRQSQKMEAIGVMAGGVAHDLNNILAGVVTYPEMIRQGLPSDSPLSSPLETIENAGKRAAAVVDDLLTLARNAASVKEATDLNGLINDLLDSPEWLTIKELYPEVVLERDLEAEILTIYCSQVHIRKCLMNLLHNGVEAAAPKGMVTIATRNVVDDSPKSNDDPDDPDDLRSVNIVIADSGPGIAEEHIEHIFEPFYTTKKMGHSGSGLGLSVVWNTVKEHGGTVSVENGLEGAVFHIQFPVTDMEITEKQEDEEIEIESLKGSGAVVVVDDEEPIQEIACKILRMLGYAVVAVSSGEEAIAFVKKQDVDLLVLDMLMGKGLNGYETYREILGFKPDQKAIIASGFANSEEVQKTLALGAHSIIKKPYSLEQLGAAVKKCMLA